jgi:hypothetical protein
MPSALLGELFGKLYLIARGCRPRVGCRGIVGQEGTPIGLGVRWKISRLEPSTRLWVFDTSLRRTLLIASQSKQRGLKLEA